MSVHSAVPMEANQVPLVEVRDLVKRYPSGTTALKGVSFQVSVEDFIVIIGCSGAGKSTLLRCLNRLLKPTSGQVLLLGEDISTVSSAKLQRVRRRVGMIFQQFHLVPRLTVLENVLAGRLRFQSAPVPHTLSLARIFPKRDKELAFRCLQEVGIEHLALQRADTLSGGQQQRVAIARVLAQEPEVILADEPIASLDPRSASTVMNLLRQIHERKGIPVLVNLHHLDFVRRYAGRILGMQNGRLVYDGPPSLLEAELVERIYQGSCDVAWEELPACA
ncbi:phosphonate transport system ATP-binding protein [Desulfacinum hydrothermale DSM 13146]|uniref:Phosphonate transport system ATP-binding protein n=1 Tax=Desulfacinum hydrothermale DSM 13146 TaxID=1121390 RepID=A0A1W1XI16_9BACT|nr:phosphonate ABC transporter ATP-binding protein [Desulfacinum hydrothermale]SMC23609.1 phosphonate transport system ATP-binding protein [Desulfacinum hydrothermale DSM 13146]